MGAFPGFADNREAMLRVIRNHRRAAHGETRRLRRPVDPPAGPLDAANCPDARPRRGGQSSLGPGARAGRAARLPQRPGLGHRPYRHDRPGDGLRHDRHRARLRAGEVQEAGRRRLLQDHQPDGAAGAARRWATTRRRSSASSPTRSATARSPERPAINHETLAARGFDRADASSASKSRSPTAFDIRFAFSRYTLGDDFCRERLGLDDAALADPQLDVLARLGFSSSDIAAANVHACGTMTHRGRAAISSASISRCSIVQIPVDEMARAACLQRVTYA